MIFSSVRTLVELPVNPLNPEHSQPDDIFGINNRRWSEALAQLGLVVVTPYPAVGMRGERLPDIKATLYDKALLDAGQYALLSMVSRESSNGLSVHMVGGLREYWNNKYPDILPGVEPRELTVDEILTDISSVTIGQEQRHPDIQPTKFEPTLQVCRDIGTIGLLERAQKV